MVKTVFDKLYNQIGNLKKPNKYVSDVMFWRKFICTVFCKFKSTF